MAKSKKEQDELRVEKEWQTVDSAVKKSGNFIEKNQKPLLIGVGAIVVVVCIFLAVKQFYLDPRNEKAQAELFKGEEYFRSEQDSLTLFGDGKGFDGMVAFVNEYGLTKAGNVAKAYAGISYARLGRYEEALKFLKGFSADDELISYAVEGAIGDCYAGQNKVEEAASQFVKAAKGADDALLSPIYYKKAGIAYRQLKNYDKVIEVFTKIKNEYMNSPEAAEADKYIGEAELLKK
jgi:tetratricopeptide (TPR) repeat protein